ncbi:glycosyl hydrolase family 28-related protein [Wukongibacter sp. M2B1]|uniref:glycosyl hydrolase family 28-related protein n=1 Tax=Wukongibacter sp. M2B1 TaxID=3088895 RepID=UPI003D7B1C1F
MNNDTSKIRKIVTPQMFGAIGDGNADDTIAMQEAIDKLEEGETLTIPPGKYKCNINIFKSNITIVGERGQYYKGSYLSPVDITKPCITIGNGKDYLGNISLNNITLLGTNEASDSDSVGLKLYGAQSLYFNELNIQNFGSNNVEIDSGNIPNSYIYFNNFRTANSHKSCFYVDFGVTWSTAIYINNFSFQVGKSNDSRCITLKGKACLNCSNGWIESSNYKGIDLYDLSKIQLTNVAIDSGNSNDVLVKQFDQEVSRLCGLFTIDGKIENSLGIKIPSLGKAYFPDYVTLRDPIVHGRIYFIDKYNINSEEDYDPSYDNRVELKDGKIYFAADGSQFYFDSKTRQLKDYAIDGGDKASRPSNPIQYQQYYDTSLNKVIIYDGNNWRDSMGGIV